MTISRNGYFIWTVQFEWFEDKVRDMFGHMLRRHSRYTEQRMLNVEMPGKNKIGSPPRRPLDAMKDMQSNDVTQEDGGR